MLYRVKKAYEHLNLEETLAKLGINFSSNRLTDENTIINAQESLLQLEPFDDSEYEKRTPNDYLIEVNQGKKEGVQGKAI